MSDEEKKSTSPLWYLLGGAAIGTALGMLFAPKSGKELRHDIVDWSKRGKETGRDLLVKLGTVAAGKEKNYAGFAKSENGERLLEPTRKS